MKKMLIILSFILFSNIFSSCSSLKTYKDFKVSDVQKGEGIVLAKIIIKYNGENFNDNCTVCFSSTSGPCQKLTKTGLVFINLEVGSSSVSRIACMDGSPQFYNIENASFKVKKGINYVGDIQINWANEGGFKATQTLGLLGALIDELHNDGNISMNVTDKNKKIVIKKFSQQSGHTPKKIFRNLASTGE
jgi:hypothetical protein